MDVSSTSAAQTNRPVSIEPRCDVCGYLRVGLPHGARCPECGHAPPVEVAPLVADLVGAAKNRSEQAWMATIVLGLILLIISSICALQVTLIMPLGGLVLTAMNVPAPKLCAAALFQRSIGEPGPWGVYGTLAVLGNVMAIWLITEPRAVLAQDEPTFSLRRMTRWSCVIGGGGVLGFMLSGYEQNVWWGWSSMPALAAVLGAVELPVNTLLCWYLARLSERFDQRGRNAALMRAACWLVPVAVALGAGLAVVRGLFDDQPVAFWRLLQSLYGSLALAAGMVMTCAILRLTANLSAAVMDRSMVTLGSRMSRLRLSLGRVLSAIRTDPTRWAAAAGLVLWLWNARPLVGLGALIDHRRGLGGDLPSLNFIGPKVWAIPLLEGSSTTSIVDRLAIVSTVLAVWLITAFRPAGISKRGFLFTITRWAPTVLIGIAMGLAITIDQAKWEIRESHQAAALMIGVEAPATLVVYLYLSRLAGSLSQAKLARQLRYLAYGATALILSPVWFYLLSKPLRGHHDNVLVLLAAAGYGALVVAAGVLAWALLVRLAWGIVTMTNDQTRMTNQ